MAPKCKKYFEADLKNVIAKAYNIPRSTLKGRLKITPSLDKLPAAKEVFF